MRVTLIPAPYDSGLRDVRMGSGPIRLLASDLPERLEAAGHQHDVAAEPVVECPTPANPVRSAFDVIAAVGDRVRVASDEGSFPVLLSGNCNTMLGAVAGIGSPEMAVFWLDAHGDFNTPEITTTGFLDGMALAMLVGRCWSAMIESVPDLRPISERHVALIGARDLDPLERRALERSEVALLPPAELGENLIPTLDRIGGEVSEAYIHIDLDVLDPDYGRANELAVSGGLSPEGVEDVIDAIAERFRIRGLTLASYDPAVDAEGNIVAAALRLLPSLLSAVESAGSA